MNRVSQPANALNGYPTDTTVLDRQPPGYRPMTPLLGSFFLGACIDRLLYRQVDIRGRKVRLMRHIPLIGICGSLAWGVTKGLFPKPVYCTNLDRKDVLLSTPYGDTTRLFFRPEFSSDNRPVGIRFNGSGMNCQHSVLRLIKLAAVGISATVLSAMYLPTFLVIPPCIAFYFFLIAGWVTEYPRLEVLAFDPGVKGTLIRDINTDQFKQKLQSLANDCESNKVHYQTTLNNCSSPPSRILRECVPEEFRAHIGKPLCFSMPLDVLIMANNIHAIKSALNEDGK
ncbi:hypothetical protein [Parendozoicomonas haliclonae]|uniref:Uncharacterized protein n=1 Tax=Parendozoicomonas haliclonae TaxID=1960125 RepID=A0A1X7ANM7_9GAMM|nr:hypothetical protein [Parendozoicomonas haliclonae]SMA49904.1 hypothetical protein EHSB41UT_03695 [Parendozoicomonas haliclonae]